METGAQQGQGRLSDSSQMGVVVLLALLLGCGPTLEEDADSPDHSGVERQTQSTPSKEPAIQFADVSAESGLDFINVSGSAAQDYVLESMSAGAAFLDYDGDGYQDLFVVNGTRLRGVSARGKKQTLPQ